MAAQGSVLLGISTSPLRKRARPAGISPVSAENPPLGSTRQPDYCTLRRVDPVHRITLCDLLELRQRLVDNHRQVVAPSRRDAHVLAEDGSPFGRGYTNEVDGALESVTEDGIAMSGLDVLDPIRPRAEHRNQVLFCLLGWRSQRGSPAADLRRGHERRGPPSPATPARGRTTTLPPDTLIRALIASSSTRRLRPNRYVTNDRVGTRDTRRFRPATDGGARLDPGHETTCASSAESRAMEYSSSSCLTAVSVVA